jgi:antitoxin VapB
MALNIKNSDVEHLAGELARLTGSSKTEAIRQALLERRERLAALASGASREDRLRQFLELRVWPAIPRKARRRWTKDEEDAALGYGDSGEPV